MKLQKSGLSNDKYREVFGENCAPYFELTLEHFEGYSRNSENNLLFWFLSFYYSRKKGFGSAMQLGVMVRFYPFSSKQSLQEGGRERGRFVLDFQGRKANHNGT